MAKTQKVKRQRRPMGWIGQVSKRDAATGEVVTLPGYYYKVLDPITGKRVQRHGGDTLDDAQKAMAAFMSETRPDPKTGLVGRKLSKLIEEFLVVAQSRVSDYHAKTLKAQLQGTEPGAGFLGSVGDVPLRAITRATIESYLVALGKGPGQRRRVAIEKPTGNRKWKLVTKPMSPNTQRRHLSAIGALFEFALERQYVKANPARGVKLRKVQQFEPVVLTAEQITKLYGHLPERIRAVSIFVGETGARLTEGLELQWHQIADDFSAVTFTLTKNRKTRRVPLTARVVEVLKALHEVRVAPMRGEDPVFPYCSTSAASVLFRRAVKEAGLPAGATMHSLRHSYAVGLTLAGVPFSVTCKLLGHSTPAFTAARYARWVPDGEEARAVAALERARGAMGAAAVAVGA